MWGQTEPKPWSPVPSRHSVLQCLLGHSVCLQLRPPNVPPKSPFFGLSLVSLTMPCDKESTDLSAGETRTQTRGCAHVHQPPVTLFRSIKSKSTSHKRNALLPTEAASVRVPCAAWQCHLPLFLRVALPLSTTADDVPRPQAMSRALGAQPQKDTRSAPVLQLKLSRFVLFWYSAGGLNAEEANLGIFQEERAMKR